MGDGHKNNIICGASFSVFFLSIFPSYFSSFNIFLSSPFIGCRILLIVRFMTPCQKNTSPNDGYKKNENYLNLRHQTVESTTLHDSTRSFNCLAGLFASFFSILVFFIFVQPTTTKYNLLSVAWKCFALNKNLIFYSISYYYEFSKEQDYICSKPADSGMHMCSTLPPYRIGPMICNGEYTTAVRHKPWIRHQTLVIRRKSYGTIICKKNHSTLLL